MTPSSPDSSADRGASLAATTPEAFALPGQREVLAASAPWLGALLNVLPGLGAGYLYQRRWRAWWITSLLGALGFALGGLPQAGSDASAEPVFGALGFAALLLLAAVTAAEAFLAARRARMG